MPEQKENSKFMISLKVVTVNNHAYGVMIDADNGVAHVTSKSDPHGKAHQITADGCDCRYCTARHGTRTCNHLRALGWALAEGKA